MTLISFQDGRSFAQGVCKYQYRPVTSGETTPRIVVQVQIGNLDAQAVVDTGGAYLVCDPQIAAALDLDATDALESVKLNIRGVTISGSIHRPYLTLLAEEGESVELEVTAFVPRSDHLQWDLPSFMGLSGCLERLRFAVDPLSDAFYFGALEED